MIYFGGWDWGINNINDAASNHAALILSKTAGKWFRADGMMASGSRC